MFQDDLKAQITNAVENGDAIDYRKVANTVVDRWGVHDDQDERYRAATVMLLEKEAKSLINSFRREKSQRAEQMSLGIEEKHLQAYYIFDSIAYPIEQMSSEMITAKAQEHRSQGMGHLQHAVELEQYHAVKFEGAIQQELAAEN